ncbi:EpsG family protein [Acinetobacter radioresistens]|uniref:EpsG family protein n=1 Tax=Acinetobacter radioresistens TaxID=40216 RepID=UPI001D185EA9|nr:EpsG family protein [Acinetobacter radioresistens]
MFWIFLEKKSLNRNAFWVPFFVLVLFSSIRSYLVGTDTGNYTSDFRNLLDSNYYIFRSDLEYGYQLLEYFVLKFTHNYFWLFFVSSVIVVGSYLYIFRKKSEDYLLSVIIFVSFGFYLFYFNGLRQGLAMAIVALGTPYLINKHFLKYALIILLASFFHKTALIMFLFYFTIHLEFKLEFKAIAVFLGSFLMSGAAIQYLASTNEKYSGYAEVSENAGGYLSLLFYFSISLFLYIFYKKYKINNPDYYILLQLCLYGVLFLIPVSLLGANPSGPQRLLFYFVWVVSLLIPIVIVKLNSKFLYTIFIFLAFIYYSMVLGFGNLLPYRLNEIFRIF